MKMFDADENRMIGLPYGEETDDMLSRFHLIPERYGRTDGRTDGQICYINIARQYTRDKNHFRTLLLIETLLYVVVILNHLDHSKKFCFID